MPTDTISAAIAVFDKSAEVAIGCSDGYCRVKGKASGMHTNGGCRCYTDKMKAQIMMSAGRRLRDDIEPEFSRLQARITELESERSGIGFLPLWNSLPQSMRELIVMGIPLPDPWERTQMAITSYNEIRRALSTAEGVKT